MTFPKSTCTSTLRESLSFLAAAVAFFSCGWALIAAPLGVVPQSSHGLHVGVTYTASADAMLHVVELSDPDQNPSADAPPFSAGILWGLPVGTDAVSITATSLAWRQPLEGEFSDSLVVRILSNPLPLASVSDVMQMRGIPLACVSLNALQTSEDGQGVRVCESFDVHVSYQGTYEPADTRYSSSSFYDLARGVVANLDDVLPVPESTPENYLIITKPAYLETISDLVTWRREQGHGVRLVTTDSTGTTAAQILAYIQNAYDTWEEPPVFVLLVGDEDGANGVPTWQVPGYYTATIASDHPYTLLDGSDYLPDVFIGRLSADTPVELQTIVNKCVRYEKEPFEPDGAWRSRMLITGVRSSPNFYPSYNSSWPTLQWIGRQFLQSGYAQIDSVPYPPGNASQINSRVNNGVSFIAYRGFGSPSDWAFPPYNLSDMNNINNGERLPVVMSIVCGGGAFSYQTDPCFGEKWLRLGTPSSPRGAIGFIGPSELDTKTRWNNTNIAGIFDGILHEGINTLGAAMLRGKMELVRQFPNNLNNNEPDSDQSVSFYFKCYNLLGDPGQTFFVGPVRDLTANTPDSVSRGTSAISVEVLEDGNPVDGAWGTVEVSDTIFSRSVSHDGEIVLDLPQSGADSAIVTLCRPRHEVQQTTVTLNSEPVVIGASAISLQDDGENGSFGNGDGLANPGERLAIGLRVTNYGSSPYGGGTLRLDSESSEIQLVDSLAAITALAPGGESSLLVMRVDVGLDAPDESVPSLTAEIDNGAFAWPIPLDIQAPSLLVYGVQTNGDNTNPEPSAISTVALAIRNVGRGTTEAFTATLHSSDPSMLVMDSTATYPSLAPGEFSWPLGDGYQISIGDAIPGDRLPVQLHAENANFSANSAYLMPVGNLQVSDPTAPDSYGYRVYQDSDAGHSEAPTYSWVEIDPAHGGLGSVVSINDPSEGRDTTVTVDLPFEFRFYGTIYDQVSICSNGFVSFGATAESYFRNYALPAIASPDNMVCVFWDDLWMPTGSHICTYHDVTGGRFIIEWSRLRNQYGTGLEETFELILSDAACWPTKTGDGDLLMQYLSLNNVDSWDNYATIGLQDRGQAYSLQVTYANILAPGVSTLRSGQALLCTTGRPDSGAYLNYDGNIVDDDSTGGSFGNGDGIPQNGETIQLQVVLSNAGSSSAPAFSGTLRSLDPLAILLDSLVSFSQIPPGQSEAGGAVRLQVSPNMPHGHSANLVLQLAGDATPCVVLPSVAFSSPVLTMVTTSMDDDSIPPSNGNGNGEFNSGETIALTPVVTNAGGNIANGVIGILRRVSGPITIVDSVSALGEVLVGQQVSTQAPFTLQVGANVPDGAPFVVSTVLRDEYGNEWTTPSTWQVVEPSLEADGLRIADPLPGGNADGRLVGGEQGEIFLRVRNTGMGTATGVTVTLTTEDSTIVLQGTTVLLGTVSAQSVRESNEPVLVSVVDGISEPRNVHLNVHVDADGGLQLDDELILTIGDVLYFDDLENGQAGWSIFGTQNLWHLQTRESNSPTHAFYCGLESQHLYPPMADAYLRSPRFEFSGTGRLIFSTRYSTQTDGDECRVQLQIGPSTYFTLDHLSGVQNDWQQRQYSLAGYPTAPTAYIRFWFVSDNSGSGEGCYLDDIMLVDEPEAVENSQEVMPDKIELSSNFPNPFNSRTIFTFALTSKMSVQLDVYDVTGRFVATLAEGWREAGVHRVAWDPFGLASGVYLIHLRTDRASLTRKVVLLK